MKNKLINFITIITVISIISLIGVVSAHAASLSIRLEQPKSPTNDDSFKISFVTLETENQAVKVKCFIKGPNDSVFSQFGSDIDLAAGGNSGDCEVTSQLMNTQGSYQFYAQATAGSELSTSETVTVTLDKEGPATPYNFSKERVNTCEYKIKFKTAADGGQTKKVEIYMSTFTSFAADSGTKAGEVGIGSDLEGSFQTAAPDCNKTFYFAIRAFDLAGNGSGIIGDGFTTVITKEPTTVTTTTIAQTGVGAIPVSTSQVGTGGEILGGVLGEEATPGAEVSPTPQPTTFPGNLFNLRNIITGFILVLVVYFLYRRFAKKV